MSAGDDMADESVTRRDVEDIVDTKLQPIQYQINDIDNFVRGELPGHHDSLYTMLKRVMELSECNEQRWERLALTSRLVKRALAALVTIAGILLTLYKAGVFERLM